MSRPLEKNSAMSLQLPQAVAGTPSSRPYFLAELRLKLRALEPILAIGPADDVAQTQGAPSNFGVFLGHSA